MMRRGVSRDELLLSLPSYVWLLLLFALPAILVLAAAFRTADAYGGIRPGWTLDAIRTVADPLYYPILRRTLWISALTTCGCLLFAVPTGYYLGRAPIRRRRWLLLLIIIPFWTSFLARIFAWKVMFRPEGPVAQLLAAFGLIEPDAQLLYRPWAVVAVQVYTFLPYAILPIYAAAERFDYSLLEAALDLGASPRRAFFSVFLPGIRRAVLTAAILVLVPSLGSYVIPDLVGGPHGELLGSKIAQRTFVDRNLPQASALASLLFVLILVPTALALRRPVQLRRRGAR